MDSSTFWSSSRSKSSLENRADPRCGTLLALAYLRCGQPRLALAEVAAFAAQHQAGAASLYAIDLCVAALAHRALEETLAAAESIAKLDTLLASRPSLLTPRVRALREEAEAK